MEKMEKDPGRRGEVFKGRDLKNEQVQDQKFRVQAES